MHHQCQSPCSRTTAQPVRNRTISIRHATTPLHNRTTALAAPQAPSMPALQHCHASGAPLLPCLATGEGYRCTSAPRRLNSMRCRQGVAKPLHLEGCFEAAVDAAHKIFRGYHGISYVPACHHASVGHGYRPADRIAAMNAKGTLHCTLPKRVKLDRGDHELT